MDVGRDVRLNERTILHLDMDSYFATCEQQANPNLRGKPIVVSGDPKGRSVVSAASKEAKEFGIKSAMPAFETKKLCPKVIFVYPDFYKYKFVTEKIIAIVEKFTPQVEIASIDEVFLDITKTFKRFGGVTNVANKIKQNIKNEIGDWMTCSIGIAPNKMLAKIASDLKKPDGLVIIKENEVKDFLEKLPLKKVCGIGIQTNKALLRLGVKKVFDLTKIDQTFLLQKFGARGYQLIKIRQGRDYSEVVSYHFSEEAKSYSHQTTLEKNTIDRELINSILLRLSERVAQRMRRDKALGRVVKINVRYDNFTSWQRQTTLDFFTDDGRDIFNYVTTILETHSPTRPVRLLGVGVSKIVSNKQQLPLLGRDKKRRKILTTLDSVNNRYGKNTVVCGDCFKHDSYKKKEKTYRFIERGEFS